MRMSFKEKIIKCVFFSVLTLCVSLVFISAFPSFASVASEAGADNTVVYGAPESALTFNTPGIANKALEDALVSGFKSAAVSFVINGYTPDEINSCWNVIHFSHPELFYVDTYSYSYNPVTPTVITVIPTYNMTGSALTEAVSFYNAKIKEITAGVPADADDFDKILYINDYLCYNFMYEEDITDSVNYYDAYNFFKSGYGVCQAYTMAFTALMRELDIETSYAQSTSMAHIWNVVKLDGKWYHIDVTWNDPVFSVDYGFDKVSHRYFLLSDAKIAEGATAAERHRDWIIPDSGIVCDDTAYDNAFWRDIYTPIYRYNGEWYYYANGYAKVAKADLITVSNYKDKSGSSVSCRAVGVYNDYLIVSTKDTISAYGLSDGEKTKLYDAVYSGKSIWEMRIDGEFAYISVSKRLDDINPDFYAYKLSSLNHEHIYVPTVVAATCLSGGYTQYECSVCNKTYKADYTSPDPSNHTGGTVRGNYKAPTCVDNGKEADTLCASCDALLEEGADIIKTGIHTYGAWSVTVAPTCAAGGERCRSCTVCDKTESEAVPVNSQNHTGATILTDAVASTCSDGGYSGNTVCSSCGAVIAVGHALPVSNEHSYGPWSVDIPATCTDTGSGIRTCTVCGNTDTDPIPVNPENHTGGTELRNISAPTCGANGYTGDVVCLSCGETVTPGQTILPTGIHSYGAWITDTVATCADKGTRHRVCGVCEACENGVTETDPENHTGEAVRVGITEENCGNDGYTGDLVCPGCGYIYEAGSTIPRSGAHSYKDEWEGDESGHFHLCTVCRGHSECEQHLPVGAATTESASICSVCGYEIAPRLVLENRELIDTENKIQITGELTPDVTQSISSLTDAVRLAKFSLAAQVSEYTLYGAYDIKLSGRLFKGPYLVSLTLGVEYNGASVLIVQEGTDGNYLQKNNVCTSGVVSFTTDSVDMTGIAIYVKNSEKNPAAAQTPSSKDSSGTKSGVIVIIAVVSIAVVTVVALIVIIAVIKKRK